MFQAINGASIAPESLNINVQGVLQALEGPWLEHALDKQHNHFLLQWSGRDSQHDRWMLYRVPPVRLLDFLNERVNSLDLILENPDGFVLFLDFGANGRGKPVGAIKARTVDIPKDYLPSADSYFEKGDFMNTPYCEQLRQQLEARLTSNQLYKIRPEPSPTVLNEPPTE
jgi:hypothetical protein